MITREMQARAVSVREIASHLGVERIDDAVPIEAPADALDGRRDRPSVMDDWQDVVQRVLERLDDVRVVPGSTRRVGAQDGPYDASRASSQHRRTGLPQRSLMMTYEVEPLKR